MSQTLPADAAAERLRWIQPYLDGQRSLREIADISPLPTAPSSAGWLPGVEAAQPVSLRNPAGHILMPDSMTISSLHESGNCVLKRV